MRKLLFLLTALLLIQQVFAQKTKRLNQVGISVPVIWNNTRIFNVYSGTGAEYISGSAISYGVNFNYSRSLYKNFFLTGGVGYHIQNFGVRRPFDFDGDTITKLQYNTKRYAYSNLYWFLGAGYFRQLNNNYNLIGSITYNRFYSFRQEFIPTGFSGFQHKETQVEKRYFFFGASVNLNAGLERHFTSRLSLRTDLALPVYTKRRKHKVFRENENEFNHSRYNVGINISLLYHLNQN